ncbi:hypothetical protein EW145_g1278 [Phellinidium pouzarii]|uniref:Uncharacterized protein n=1 Tax=Phellinidium pouzarii TaxID=167371 RepID=A0A4S4LF63_9AGAM|nr:hypothetical protein EW145_g1278 [Phellinidium pouzarii]
MVGTPQLPLKYRRKGDTDYRICSPELDMAYHSPTSSFYSRIGSDDSMPRSPVFYSSSSVAPSSPMCSLHTPEPPSSPLAEVHVASSPKSFWEVAFNHGPEFPYKARSSTKSSSPDSVFSRDQFFSRRRSSDASVPALVSDLDPSDYSEDIDPFNMDDDSVEDFDSAEKVVVVKKENDTARGPGIPLVRRDDRSDRNMKGGTWSGEIDVASVLLDLSRQVRIAPSESRSKNATIKPIDRSLSDRPTTLETISSTMPSSISLVPSHPEECPSAVHQTLVQMSCTSQADETASLSNPDEYAVSNIASPEAAVGPSNFVSNTSHVEDKHCPKLGEPNILPAVFGCTQIESEQVAEGAVNVGATMLSEKFTGVATMSNESICTSEAKVTQADVNEDSPSEVDYVVASIFLSTLTPLSSPSLGPTEDSTAISDYVGCLSNLSSPATSVLDLAAPCEASELHSVPSNRLNFAKEKENINIASIYTTPIPGPSKSRSISTDERNVLVKLSPEPLLRKSKSKQSLCEAEVVVEAVDTNAINRKRKRPRLSSKEETRSSLLTVPESMTPKPRKRNGKKTALDTSQHLLGNELTKKAGSLSSCASHVSASSSSAPPDRDAALGKSADDTDAIAKAEVYGCLIQAMALSRTSSMPASSLLREVLRENPHLGNGRSREGWLDVVEDVLISNDVFGRVDREGLDADDKPLEAQWFYIPENDPDEDRASLLREMMPKKRKETKKHKQYFYKPLGVKSQGGVAKTMLELRVA